MPDCRVLDAVTQMLVENGVSFREIHHAPTRTSEDAARARSESLEIGGKALLVKVGDTFILCVLSAASRLNSSAVRRMSGARKLRFATSEELADMTGLVPGSVPPFGHPILPFDLWLDESIVSNDRIAFNAGSLTDSIVMSTKDYLRLANPARIAPIATPPD